MAFPTLNSFPLVCFSDAPEGVSPGIYAFVTFLTDKMYLLQVIFASPSPHF